MAEAKSLHQKLTELTGNLWWSWQAGLPEMFRAIDQPLWSGSAHNPLVMLEHYNSDRLELRARELGLHSRINYAYRRWQEYVSSQDTWGATRAGILNHQPVAYFSAEFGLHESMPIYSGGLGILAGDHLKSASDLGIPLVGVGLLYGEGYFSQHLDQHGWQQESYKSLHPEKLPLRPALGKDGNPVLTSVQTRTGQIFARVWRCDVGRIPLYLLDTNIPNNTEEDRRLTARLYGGDSRTRIRQEIMLGIAGARALVALGIQPSVIHMNEGHSAFAPLEIIRTRIKDDGLPFDEALRDTAASCCFTTHTPVEAGHDRFDAALVEEHVGPLADELGLSHEALVGLGRVNPQNTNEAFCMTVLAFKLSRKANAVSALHGVVSRRMWASLWPWQSEEEIPIGHITNGVHVPTWLAPQMRVLYDRVLPANWHTRTGEPDAWNSFEQTTTGELWEVHQSLKNQLIGFTRRRLEAQARRNDATEEQITEIQGMLDPRALLIGFARRFAPYKRTDLILRDFDLMANVINDSKRPVQFIFAGKSHPRDDNGKAILQRVWKATQESRLKGRVIFLEDYDINLARHLVQGVDVWLNNPRRPLEASGTSGQKVVLNGVLNLSVLDGWWAEAYDGTNGFAIGTGRSHVNSDIQDQRDWSSLIDVLKTQVIPMYYDRDPDDLPQQWVKRIKRSVRTLGWRFNSDRMVMDYVNRCYVPAAGGLSSQIPGM